MGRRTRAAPRGAGGTVTSNRTIPERPVPSTDGFELVTLDGRYHIVERVASGGMGEVFRAHDAVLAREVAIKVLHRSLAADAAFVERFRREARAAAALMHPNIVAVHDWGAVDGIYYMVMEFVRGQSLRDVLTEHGPLAPAQAAEVLLQVLAALDHAHRQGIVHRDVKPENVLLTPEGVAKVADFGLARAWADARITQDGRVSGTVQYLAPEQLRGEPADPRTDLYSLGIVAYELLTGRLPFAGETPMAIAYAHLRDRVPRPSARNPAVTDGLDGWVASLTEKERELRPESAAEARRDLQREAASLPPAAPVGELVRTEPTPERSEVAPTVRIPSGRTERHRRRRRLRWAAGALLALSALAAAAWGAWTYLVPHEVSVPRVLGVPLERARDRLEAEGLVVRIAKGAYDDEVREGLVLAQRPDPGTVLREGSTVVLVPSLGPPPVRVPNLVDRTIEEARALLGRVGLELAPPRERYDERFAVGHIISQSVPPKDRVPRGTAISVVVSKGPAPVPVPNVIGETREDAEALLGAAWVVDVRERYSDDVERGRVISQSPAPKERLQPGEAVTIVVSLGPRTLPVPNLVGMTRDAAVAELRALGLVPSVIELPGATGELTVATQLPLAGTVVKAGSTVTIYVG
ncbi:MAG: serine/threonine protein kinase [Actinomycetota bacterium]|nr:MAG: serine/threonine protein kinase [Actinomycetota bacterium]